MLVMTPFLLGQTEEDCKSTFLILILNHLVDTFEINPEGRGIYWCRDHTDTTATIMKRRKEKKRLRSSLNLK